MLFIKLTKWGYPQWDWAWQSIRQYQWNLPDKLRVLGGLHVQGVRAFPANPRTPQPLISQRGFLKGEYHRYLYRITIDRTTDKRRMTYGLFPAAGDPTVIICAFCLQFDTLFLSYTKYCLEQKAMLEYIKTKQRENELFKTFVNVSRSSGTADHSVWLSHVVAYMYICYSVWTVDVYTCIYIHHKEWFGITVGWGTGEMSSAAATWSRRQTHAEVNQV